MSDRETRVAAVLFGLAEIVTLVLVLGQSRLPSVPEVSNLPGTTNDVAGLEPDTSDASPAESSVLAAPSVGPSVAPTTAAPTTANTAPPTTRPATTSTPTPTTKPSPTAAPTPTPNPAPKPTPAPPPGLGACDIFPASNVWNRPVDDLPVASNSATMIAAIGLDAGLHPDFSDGGWYGIPYNVVGSGTPRSTVLFQYDDESDHVGYPIPADPAIESG